MKKIIFPLLLLFISLQANAQDNNPVEYMNLFSTHYNTIAEKSWDYTSSIARGKKAAKIEADRQVLISSLLQAKIEVKKIKDYNGDVKLRDAVINYLDIIYIVMKEDYSKIIDMEAIAEQSYDFMEAYILAKEEASKKIDEAQAIVENEEKRFAEENEVILTADNSELKQKHEKANLVFEYYNDMYLIFFKSFKNDLYLSEAIQSLNVSGIEQNKTSASDYASEGKTKMEKLGSFDGDKSLLTACSNLLAYYEKDAKTTVVLDFILAQEKVNKLKSIIDKKKKSDLTQSEIDEFNKSVEQSNQLVAAYNTYNEESYKEKSKLIEAWNKEVQKFLDTHTPK